MSRYQRGARIERIIKEKLEDRGCFAVRSAGSRGPVDLVSLSPDSGDVDLIQVKSTVKDTLPNNVVEKAEEKINDMVPGEVLDLDFVRAMLWTACKRGGRYIYEETELR